MPVQVHLDHITIVLHHPRLAENIGATARAAWNMGIHRLALVNPKDTDWERMSKLATHVASGILEKMAVHSSLAEALAPFQYIVGTTARLGGVRKEPVIPSEAARKIHSLGPRNRVALLFGPENRGLSNEELRFCHDTVHIPTSSASPLNLAQAVLILCYEILLVHQREWPPQDQPPLASSFELEGMYGHLMEALLMMDFLDEQNPERWMMSLRRFFSRVGLYSHEVRMVRGVCRQLKWFVTNQRRMMNDEQ
jgi:tRNA/rRNA methyltransferase